MDSVFVITQNPPKVISEKEMVLARPSFIDEVKACQRKRGGSATIGANYLRAIAEEIGRRYDKAFNPFRNVVPHDFAGRICSSDEDVAKTVHEMFQARYPAIYQKYYETLLRKRSFGIKVIYFTGAETDAVIFQKLGILKILENEVDAHLGVDSSKVEVKSTSENIKIVDEDAESLMALKELVQANENLVLRDTVLQQPTPVAAPIQAPPKPRQLRSTQNATKVQRPV